MNINDTVRKFARIFIFRLPPDSYNEGFELYMNGPMSSEDKIFSLCCAQAFRFPNLGTEEERKALQEYKITRKVLK